MNCKRLTEKILPNSASNDGALEIDLFKHANKIYILSHYFYDNG